MSEATLSRQISMRLVVTDVDAVPLPCEFIYRESDPLAITLKFSGDGMTVDWIFARELLNAGMTTPTGDGDVHSWPSWGTGRHLLMISCTSPDGQAVLEAPMEEVQGFLADTENIMPIGGEIMDLDAEIAKLLG